MALRRLGLLLAGRGGGTLITPAASTQHFTGLTNIARPLHGSEVVAAGRDGLRSAPPHRSAAGGLWVAGQWRPAAPPRGATGNISVRWEQSTASPLGVSATSRLDAEVERKYIPGFEEHVAGDSDNVEAIQRVFDLENASNAQLLRADIQKAIAEFQQFEGDTGSTPVQVAVLTTRIKNTQAHTTANRKDISSRRGLVAMIEKRRKLLQYLKRKDFTKYNEVIRRLGIRPVAGLR